MTAQFPIILLLVALVLLSGGFLALLIGYIRLSKRLQSSEKEKYTLKTTLNKRPLQLMQEAETKALQIIADANHEASELIEKTKATQLTATSKLESDMNSLTEKELTDMHQTSKDLQTHYTQALEKLKDENINLLKNITKNIETTALAQVTDFKQQLEKETAVGEKVVNTKLQEEYAVVKKQIKDYQAEQQQEIEQHIIPLLRRTAELTFGKALSFEEHQQLVMQALEQAKKEGAFS